ncbi:lysophospholipid acyltransferase family protein [Hyphobacterium marinum]|uniref:Lysophospholipid acyltransferase family protein n=1 Tax=Hyphobacterium marinum TaxID=3116574 RepID=A0ABU7LWP2_9PROT|nr:lysophospholipid acyltransferase family protein [Hyphobacterium sp. Y6023]MEE2565968.1 lysophospholipid acyltransferase family protein [Hyphobacterium sp. Y6023]
MSVSIWQKIGWRAEALIWDAYNGFFRLFPLDRASTMGGAILRFIGPLTSTHHVARVNMQRAFPDAKKPEIDRLLSRMWDGFGRMLGETPHMAEFAGEKVLERVEIEGLEHVEGMRNGEAAIVISGHFSNWEVMGAALAWTGLDLNITYRHANNPLIDKRILDSRHEYGIRLLTAKGSDGAKALIAALRKGTSVALMNDQKMNDGVAAPFFGFDAMTAPGPTKLAMRVGAPIIPVITRRLEGARFRMTFYPPITPSENPDKAAAVVETVAKINAFIEDRIVEAPEQWFWVHRRWDKAIYRKADKSSSSASAGSI